MNFSHHIYLNDKLFTFLENIFYEIVSARNESWQMGPYRGEMIILIDKIIDIFLKYFLNLFEFL